MRKVLLFIFMIICITASSQTKDAVFNKRLSEYLALSKDLKIDALLNYMYPRIFELAPKKDMKIALEEAYNNKDINITLDSFAIGKVYPISTFSKGAFTKFEYGVRMTIRLLGVNMENNVDGILRNFQSSFGEENVRYDEELKLFRISQTKEALAIKDNYSKNLWTFIGIEKDMNITGIIPAAIKTKYNFQ